MITNILLSSCHPPPTTPSAPISNNSNDDDDDDNNVCVRAHIYMCVRACVHVCVRARFRDLAVVALERREQLARVGLVDLDDVAVDCSRP